MAKDDYEDGPLGVGHQTLVHVAHRYSRNSILEDTQNSGEGPEKLFLVGEQSLD